MMLAAFALLAVVPQAGMPSVPMPFAMPADPRIQTMAYDSGRVFDLRVGSGYAAIVELAGDERVETIVVGNDAGWEVTPNRSGNRVVVKPLGSANTTNMMIVTDQRRYVFVISADGGGGGGAFVLRFSYPAGQPGGPQKVRREADYRLKGNTTLYPIAMSDDGKRTTITWDLKTSLPAIFAIDERGREALVNGRMVDGDYVIEGVARRYVFRLGKVHADATRIVIKARP
ncbi:TrbG/VirB9 family P-type conjugative transfer protein [Sphingomonas sp. Leaf37]|uniref:TrbG/VirB9 family P-type conjugative transfer protein n=1 Tax=Sphingomonas sp. Leaf37 TaxID=2876552 RepID=UPI001E61A626|nr:TrbG/VirB9 family P-type conjugative transfer protein [Sphingomonas sp. Leaf37]